MKTRLNEIIEDLKEVLNKQYLSVSHEALFKEAMTTYRGEQMSESKQRPFNNYNKPKPKTYPATDNQLAYLQQLADLKKVNIEVRSDMTGKEVSEMIKELKKK